MFHVRFMTVLALAIGLAACSGASSGTGPGTIAPNVPSSSPLHGHHHLGPNDVIGGGPGKNLLQILLGDVALPNGSKIQAIDLGVDQIMVTDGNGNVTTVAQYSSPQVVNVLAYQGGNTTPIAQGNVVQTTYASLTIVLDTATSTYIGGAGNVHPIYFATNSGSRSSASFGSSTTTTAGPTPGTVAITFNKAFQVAGSSMNVDVDFNAMESLFPNGTYGLSHPSLTVAQQGFEGSISGNVQNAWGSVVSNAVVTATASDGSTAATGFTDQYGNFLLHTLVAGSYQLTIYNHYVTASGWTVNSTNSTSGGTVPGPSAGVIPGQTSNVGTIQD